MLKAVLFDMDGVIIDSEPIYHEINARVLDHFGIHNYTIADFDRCIGMTTRGMMELFQKLYKSKCSVDELVRYHDEESRRTFFAYRGAPIEGIPDLLKKISSKNVPTAVASSSPLELIEAIITNFGLKAYFRLFVSGHEVAKGKPAPDIFLEAARRLDVAPCDCLVIEDSENGTIAAKTAGMTCVAYQNPASGGQDLSRADEIVQHIYDIDIGKYI